MTKAANEFCSSDESTFVYLRFHTKESIKTLDIKWVFTYISTFKYLKNGILVHIDLHTLAVSRDP